MNSLLLNYTPAPTTLVVSFTGVIESTIPHNVDRDWIAKKILLYNQTNIK